MTTEVLNQKYAQLTGIRKPVSEIIEAATTADEKKATYEHLMWHIKNGVIRTGGRTKELVDVVIPALAEALEQPSTAEVIEDDPTKYTAAEANEYNMQHNPNAWPYKKQITPTRQECNEHNASITGALMYDLSVDVRESAINYTEEEAIAFNAQLPGAVSEGDVKTSAVYYTQEEADAYNTEHSLTSGDDGFVTTETIKTAEVLYTVATANAHNATLNGAVSDQSVKYYSDGSVKTTNSGIEGAYTVDTVLGTYTDDQVNEHNADWDGAVHAGDTKPTQTNDN